MNKLNIENIETVFDRVIQTQEWDSLQNQFNNSKEIYLAGNGGNLAIADHGAIDMTRHTDKNIICGGSAVLSTSIINDVGFDHWMSTWLNFRTRKKSVEDLNSCLFLGISASGTSKNVVNAMEWAVEKGMKAAVITAKPLFKSVKEATTVELGVKYYHTAEVLALILFYQLIEGGGFTCPSISK